MKRAHDLIIEYGSIEDIIKNSKYKPSPEFLEALFILELFSPTKRRPYLFAAF